MSAEWIVRTDRADAADAAGAWGALVVDMRMGWRRTAPFNFYKTTTGRTCPDDNERERARAAAAIAVARSVSIGNCVTTSSTRIGAVDFSSYSQTSNDRMHTPCSCYAVEPLTERP